MHKILTLLFVLMASNLFAQTGILKGKIIHEGSKSPYYDVTVTLPKVKIATITSANGDYLFSKVPYGTYDMVISADGIEDVTMSVTVSNPVNEVEIVEIKSKEAASDTYQGDNSAVNVEDAGTEDENAASSAGQSVSSVLNSSRDPYLSAATFGWGQYFFRPRGYENDNNMLFLNGVPMNDLEEGGVFFNSWSGLNDVFRGRSQTLGLAPNEVNFGGIGQNTNLDASASNQRKGTRFTYTATNRSYRNRIMLTHNSGLNKNGWAYSLSFSKRWAYEGPIAGTFYDAYGYFGAIEKRFKRQGFSLMLVGAPIRRGKNGPATQEVIDIAGSNYYNPNWGYQNGKVRNSRILKTHQPLIILSHDYKIDSKTTLNSAVSYQFGETAQTGLDWFNNADPRPDYYKNLPSYYESQHEKDSILKDFAEDPSKLQINWDHFYEANRNNVIGGNKRSVYIVNENVEASKKLNANINLQTVISNHAVFHAGLSYQNQNNHNFQRVADLMGGQYWENINQFASRTFGNGGGFDQNDLKATSNIVKEGDSYGYDYNIHFQKANLFVQGVFNYNKFDFFVAGEMGYNNFYRTGNYQNGLYADNSYGDSKKINFLVGRAKGGFTYKLNGRNYFYINGSTGTRAPFVDNVIVSARTRNSVISNPTTEKVNSMEAGYLLRSPNIKARVTFFATDVQNATDIKRYYISGPVNNVEVSNSFANLVMQGINKRYTGLELGAEIKVTPSLSVNLAAAFTQAFYTSRPYSYLNVDNDTSATADNPKAFDTLYIKNYNVPSGPQTALQANLNYRNKRFWFATLTANYLANNWMDFAPNLRTTSGVDNVPYDSPLWHSLLDQKKLNNVFTVDAMFGKSWKVNKYLKKVPSNYFFNINIGVNNILNNKDIQLYGFENLRTSRSERDQNTFGPKYAYALGTTYFINCVLRF